MRRNVLTSLVALAIIRFLVVPAQAVESDSSALPAGCSYEGALGHLDVEGVTNPAGERATRTSLTEAQRRALEIQDYVAMVFSKAAELNPGFSGNPHVRSLAISGEGDRKQAEVELSLEWRSGEDDEVSGRVVVGATKCGDGRGRLTTISVEFTPPDRGNDSAPIAVKPAVARSRDGRG